MHFAELAPAARLLLVPVAAFGVDLDRLAIGDFRLPGIHLDLVAAFEPLADDLQVQLAHAGGHHLLGLRVAVDAEGGVLLADLVERAGELAFVAAALGRHRQADHRGREGDGRHRQLAQRHAGPQVFQLDDRHDAAGPDLVDRLGLVGLHFEELAQLQPLAQALDRGPFRPS